MKIIFIILSFFFAMTMYAIENPKAVTYFYGGLKTLEKTTDTNTANETTLAMAACFRASEQSGIEVEMDDLEPMTSAKYTQKLHVLIFQQKSLKTDCKIIRTELAEQPDQTSGMQKSSAKHYITYVTKTYTRNGISKIYYDVVETLISDGTIVDMKNVDANGNYNSTITSTNDLSVEQLRARAAYCYTKGKSEEAYILYEQLLMKNPEDFDAAYRLGIMTLWRKGCKKRFSGKEAQKLGMQYMEKAACSGDVEIRQKAQNIISNRRLKNAYF